MEFPNNMYLVITSDTQGHLKADHISKSVALLGLQEKKYLFYSNSKWMPVWGLINKNLYNDFEGHQVEPLNIFIMPYLYISYIDIRI